MLCSVVRKERETKGEERKIKNKKENTVESKWKVQINPAGTLFMIQFLIMQILQEVISHIIIYIFL